VPEIDELAAFSEYLRRSLGQTHGLTHEALVLMRTNTQLLITLRSAQLHIDRRPPNHEQ
jgi:hypothetical protein